MLGGTVLSVVTLLSLALSGGSSAAGQNVHNGPSNDKHHYQHALDKPQPRNPSQAHTSYVNSSSNEGVQIRMYTHNIRYATDPEHREKNEQPWSVRRPYLSNDIIFNTLDPAESLVCLQEVLFEQLTDILTDLNQGNTTDDWSYIGIGRDYTQLDNEFGPIFYRPAVWQLVSNYTRWLSETPDEPSRSWGATLNRIITVGSFTHRATGIPLIASCTHLDNTNDEIRLYQSQVVVQALENFTGITNNTEPFLPVLLGGDFNSKPSESAYQNVNGSDSPMTDTRYQIDESLWYGNDITYTSFNPSYDDMRTIDFLFIGPKSLDYWHVNTSAVLNNVFDDGVFESDHRAVISDALLTYPYFGDGDDDNDSDYLNEL